MGKWRVTYDVVTPESAENGDFAEIGYAAPGGWKFPLIHGAECEAPPVMSLREAVDLAGGGFEDSGRWFTCYPETNYRTGEETRYSIHPPENITPASYRRLARLLKAS